MRGSIHNILRRPPTKNRRAGLETGDRCRGQWLQVVENPCVEGTREHLADEFIGFWALASGNVWPGGGEPIQSNPIHPRIQCELLRVERQITHQKEEPSFSRCDRACQRFLRRKSGFDGKDPRHVPGAFSCCSTLHEAARSFHFFFAARGLSRNRELGAAARPPRTGLLGPCSARTDHPVGSNGSLAVE